MATVLTVILNWRTPEMTLQSAKAALVAMQGLQGAITIVDNDSGDGSFEAMSKAVQENGWAAGDTPVRVLQSGHNGGFGAGNNYGMRAGLPDGSAPDYYFLLNSDAFPSPDAIRVLRDHLEGHPETGFAGSLIHGADDEPHLTAFRFPSVAGELEQAARLGPISRLLKGSIVAMPMPESSRSVDWLAGASMMARREVLEDIGLFDETFFLYFEETDLCLRAARAGWKTDYVKESRVMHIGSASTGMKTWSRIPKFWLDSRQHYYVKNHGRAVAFAATVAHLAGGMIWRLRALIQNKAFIDPPRYLLDMAFHGLKSLFRPIRMRPATTLDLIPGTADEPARRSM